MISNKCYYAMKAVLELAKQEGRGPVTISDIAEAQGMPARFLESILRQLKQANLTDSVRGKEGGYFLARPARDITVSEVIHLFEGPLVSINQARQPNGPEGKTVFDLVWKKADEALAHVMDNTQFEALAEADRELQLGGLADYSI